MTKYILAGGADKNDDDYGRRLAAEIYKSAKPPVKILCCLFAQMRENWEVKFSFYQNWFKEIFGDGTKVRLAFPENFIDQIKDSDIVYIHGGDDTLLAYYLNQYPDIEKAFKDKFVVGSSAGANWLANKFWTCDWRELRPGAGLIPLNVIPHYDSKSYGKDDPRGPIDWQKAKDELQTAISPDEKITPLHEGQFVVFEK